MSNEDIRKRIAKGTAHAEPLYLADLETDGCGGQDGCDGVVHVRALNDAEQSEVDAAKARGIVTRVSGSETPDEARERDQEIDIATTIEGERRGRRIAAAYGLSCQGSKWEPSTVAKLPVHVVKAISDKAEEMTRGSQEAVESFRDE